MSASFSYSPIKPKSIGANSPSRVAEVMKRVFGSFPIHLSEEDTEKVSTLALAHDDEPFFADLDRAICEHGEILVEVCY